MADDLARHVPLAVLIAAISAGCASPTREAQPAPLLHVVYFHLKDAAQVAELRADCDRLLASIEVLSSYASGSAWDTGRPEVDADYDLCLVIGLPDLAAYDAYLRHPRHEALVQRWIGELAALRVHDVWTGPAGSAPTPVRRAPESPAAR